ncbi:bone morphogenetic protein 1-like isoform X2 [Pecten maximus]|uniref:bone morphogenetic protein 1-like isoform X2 n=1 Tax=Pecten maximus TaxID=6579 RepID=UPI001458894E|nr:bone morphogenetic protein 1-like isoform X2 [Pecten maximus]
MTRVSNCDKNRGSPTMAKPPGDTGSYESDGEYLPEGRKDMAGRPGNSEMTISREDTIPIDQIIEDAEDSEMAMAIEPSFSRDQAAIKMEGDIMMPIEQFTDLQRNITIGLIQETMEMFSHIRSHNQALHTVMNAMGVATLPVQSPSRSKRAARRDIKRLWPNGVMPIRIAGSGFTGSHRRNIQQAMNRISEATCICFRTIGNKEVNRGIPHVRIINGNGCSSFIGVSSRSRGRQRSQDLQLRTSCRIFRVATHEILHALGLYHEQSRPDRNKYVKVNFNNIRRGNEHNFNRFSDLTIDSRGVPYDYESIMHYSNRAFSQGRSITLEPIPNENRKKYLNTIGKATEMSNGDIEILRKMYNCPSEPSTTPSCADYPYRFAR